MKDFTLPAGCSEVIDLLIQNWRKALMEPYLAAAGSLAFLVGFIHSILGEILIFHRLRKFGFIPTDGGTLLKERQVRILWASWHLVTVFGWCVASILIWLSLHADQRASFTFVGQAIAVSALIGSAFVLVGTKARHPGWIGLLGVAVLVWIGMPGYHSS